MTRAKSKESIRELCPEIRAAVVDEFFLRMDADYFQTFPSEEIANHIRMCASLDARRRVGVRVAARSQREFEIVIVGYDYVSEFALLCGLLSAFGFDIRSGDIFSFSRKPSERLAGRIVDVFLVALREGKAFDAVRQREFEHELHALADLLAAGSANEARERLNRFLMERVEAMGQPFRELAPVEIEFDNEASPEWTILEARADDTFGFLYAMSNALSMRGISINQARIRSDGGRAIDRFMIANRWGRKIEALPEQERLRTAVLMIEQFTRFLPDAPDPARALRHFDQFLDKLIEIEDDRFPDHAVALLADRDGMHMLAQLLGSSDFLWNDLLRVYFSELLHSIEDFKHIRSKSQDVLAAELRLATNSGAVEDRKRALNAFKDRHVFLIDAAHLVRRDASLTEFSNALTDLGEVILKEAARLGAEHLGVAPGLDSFAIFGLGKFGGREMGYASDFELLFVHEPAARNSVYEALAHFVVEFIESRQHGIFHIDLRLRPYGDAGAWSVPFEQFARYYSVGGEAEPFERQALVKLRHVAGDAALGQRVVSQRDAFTYSAAPWNWENAMHLRRRQIRELAGAGKTNVKYGAGGIVDIEYAVQYLQLLNGADHPQIRLPNTLEALDGLRSLQIIREPDYAVLHDAYLFLRRLIDSLRVVRGDATDLVLPAEDSDEYKSLARRLGYRDRDRAAAAAALGADIAKWMTRVHDYFVARFEFEA